MMKKAVLLLCLTVAFSPLAGAQNLTEEEITQAAGRWTQKSPALKNQLSPFYTRPRQVRAVRKHQLNESPLPFYVVELEPEGFIIMSSNKKLPPVLGYSSKGSINLDDVPQNALRTMMKRTMKKDMQTLLQPTVPYEQEKTFSITDGMTNEAQWDHLTQPESAVRTRQYAVAADVTGPFLTTKWNQGRHYNKLCPPDPSAGDDSRMPVGCVAVAAAQIMNYYEWPYRGCDSYTYSDIWGSSTGTYSADFSDPYDWENMLNEYDHRRSEPTANVHAISELMYEMGVAAEMDYESGGSGAYTSDLTFLLNRNFFFSRGTHHTETADILSALRTEMAASRPAVITIPLHAMVADGYDQISDNEYFHINFGWGGYNDGWYLLGNIAGDTCDSSVTGLFPDTVPLNRTETGSEFTSPHPQVEWEIADVREDDVQSIKLLERSLSTSNFLDTADTFTNFKITSNSNFKDWSISSGGYSGNCFFKPSGGYAGYTLQLTSTDPFIPRNDTVLRFRLKLKQASDEQFRVMVSSNGGQTYSSVFSRSEKDESSFSLHSISLSTYADSEILIRFECEATGSYYPAGGIWIDNIEFLNGSHYEWNTAKTITAAGAGNTVVSNLANGTYTYAFQAFDGNSWSPRSPSFSITVNTPEDHDGMPYDWEVANGLDPTRNDAAEDADNDRLSNMDEYIAGTHPKQKGSVFAVQAHRLETATGNYIIEFDTVLNRTYTVEYRDMLTDNEWKILRSGIDGTGSSAKIPDTSSPAHRFYQIRVSKLDHSRF